MFIYIRIIIFNISNLSYYSGFTRGRLLKGLIAYPVDKYKISMIVDYISNILHFKDLQPYWIINRFGIFVILLKFLLKYK